MCWLILDHLGVDHNREMSGKWQKGFLKYEKNALRLISFKEY